MANFIIIAICMIAGILFRRSGALPKDAHKGINAWLIYLALPAVSFKYLPHIQWTRDLLVPALSPIVIWLCGWLYITLYSRRQKGMSRSTQGGLKLVAGLSNTSFVGFPLIMAYFSEKELGIGIICDQVTFTLLSTIGIIIAIRSSQKQKLTARVVLKKVLTFPPLIGCVAALTIPHFIDINPLNPLFDKLAGTVGPLALFSIGLQLKFSGWRGEMKHIAFTLFYKLMLAPFIVFGIVVALGLKGIIPQISIFEAAMPTLLTSGIIADQYNLNPKLANLVVGLGICISMITTGIWFLILRWHFG
ncbi:AEC family transporter [Taibaiella lutea]|uniref:AEC family transporter n=1 Tax=Taibaiella lutea TaxID=2608001 RepID=A0A5M6CIJ1_9BACT|nr:AEC family transporter [Taibaiella lutea]KAA5534877.1 AEC family transporter [Taibaiella lutea]